MRRILFLLILILICLFYPPLSFAQEETMPEITASPSAMASPTPTPVYQLPYPGLLPDSPLYNLKTLRDRIIGFLIADPLKKAEFNLLQADKRLNAAYVLFQKGNKELAETTVSKGENYFDEALGKLHEAKSQGQDTTSLSRKAVSSLKKHEEILNEFVKRSSGSLQKDFSSTLKRVEGFQKRASSMSTQ